MHLQDENTTIKFMLKYKKISCNNPKQDPDPKPTENRLRIYNTDGNPPPHEIVWGFYRQTKV
jgi:hypothetical protein